MRKVIKFSALALVFLAMISCKEEPLKPQSQNEPIDHSPYEFSLLLDGELWLPDKYLHVKYYDNSLLVRAKSNYEGDQRNFSITIKLANPKEGTNNLEESTFNSIYCCETVDQNRTSGFVSEGPIYFTRFDTLEGFIDGEFSTEIQMKHSTTKIKIKGCFSSMPIQPNFCDVYYEVINSEKDIFNKWDIIGFHNNDSGIIEQVPCNSGIYIEFKAGDNSTDTIYLDGHSGVNNIFGSFEINENKLNKISLGQTLLGTPATHLMEYEEKFTEFLICGELEFMISDNILKLCNENGQKVLFYTQ